MASYSSVEQAIARHQEYPALDRDMKDHDFQRRRVASMVRFVQPGDIVLDVACNTGYLKDYLPQAGEIHGVDCNPEHVAVAASRLTSAQVAPAESLPFPDNTFDVVNVSGLLEQVFNCEAVMREAARVSRRSVTGNPVHESGAWGRQRVERHEWQSRSFSETEIMDLLKMIGHVQFLGTVDVHLDPPEPQCWYWCVEVGS